MLRTLAAGRGIATAICPIPPGKRSGRFQSSQAAAGNGPNASGPRTKRKPPHPFSSLPGFKLPAVMLLLRDIPPVLSFKPVIHTFPHSLRGICLRTCRAGPASSATGVIAELQRGVCVSALSLRSPATPTHPRPYAVSVSRYASRCRLPGPR